VLNPTAITKEYQKHVFLLRTCAQEKSAAALNASRYRFNKRAIKPILPLSVGKEGKLYDLDILWESINSSLAIYHLHQPYFIKIFPPIFARH